MANTVDITSKVMLVPVSLTWRRVVIARRRLWLLSSVAEKWIFQIKNIARLHRRPRYSNVNLNVVALSVRTAINIDVSLISMQSLDKGLMLTVMKGQFLINQYTVPHSPIRPAHTTVQHNSSESLAS